MSDGAVSQHLVASQDENISGTIAEIGPSVTPPAHAAPRSARACAYVVVDDWRYGGPDPFCGAPAVAGSSYCSEHLALCTGAAATGDAPRDAPPPAALEPVAVLDPPDDDPTDEIIATVTPPRAPDPDTDA